MEHAHRVFVPCPCFVRVLYTTYKDYAHKFFLAQESAEIGNSPSSYLCSLLKPANGSSQTWPSHVLQHVALQELQDVYSDNLDN